MYEELFYENEQLCHTSHDKIFLANHQFWNWKLLNKVIQDVIDACDRNDTNELLHLLLTLVPEYKKQNSSQTVEVNKIIPIFANY